MKLTIILVLLLLFPRSASWAYSIPNHQHLSLLTFELISACGYHSQFDPETVAQWSGNEDNSPYNGTVITRLRNWHFYNNSQGEDLWVLGSLINKTFHSRWRELLNFFNDPYRRSDQSQIAGALSHFIQDVSNPAHSVPIYHGPGHSDLFDYFPIQKKKLRESFPDACAELNQLKDLPATKLLNQMASKTLVHIEKDFSYQRNGQIVFAPFSKAYWVSPILDNDSFFSEYGLFGNTFGQNRVNGIFIEQKIFEEFAIERQLDAIVGTAALVLNLENQFSGK
jgi:hypothetical protein